MSIGETLKGYLNQSAHVANDYRHCFQPIAILRMYQTCERKFGDNWLYGQHDAIAVGSLLQLALVIRRLFENLQLKSHKRGKPIRLLKFATGPDQIYESVSTDSLYKLSSKIAHSRRLFVYGHYFHGVTLFGVSRFPATWKTHPDHSSRIVIGESSKDGRFLIFLSDFLDECDKLLAHIAASKPYGMELRPPGRVS